MFQSRGGALLSGGPLRSSPPEPALPPRLPQPLGSGPRFTVLLATHWPCLCPQCSHPVPLPAPRSAHRAGRGNGEAAPAPEVPVCSFLILCRCVVRETGSPCKAALAVGAARGEAAACGASPCQWGVRASRARRRLACGVEWGAETPGTTPPVMGPPCPAAPARGGSDGGGWQRGCRRPAAGGGEAWNLEGR